jgi:hypothetical protein
MGGEEDWMDRERTQRAADEFAEAVRGEAARFFEAVVLAVEEEMRRNPEAFRPRRDPISEEDAAALAVQAVREYREERRDDRKIDAPAPDQEDVEHWERMREDRRTAEDYRPR